MSTITFTVPGQPRGKGRPRFARRGNHVATYTDDQTAAYENLVALAFKAAGGTKMSGNITMKIHAFMPIPASWSKKKKGLMAGRPHTSKPDCSNIQKSVEDGLNGVAYHDDASVWDLSIRKTYCLSDESTRLEVCITSDDAAPRDVITT